MNLLRIRLISVLFAFSVLWQALSSQTLNEGAYKVGRTLNLISSFYVDSANVNDLTEKAIIEMLKNLDPHSVYISEKDVKEMNEPLMGNFEGIGIQFNLLRDTIIVIEPIAGGPSEKVGLRSGDRIINIDGEKVAGVGISTAGVRSRLMGMKGTKVNINIFRRGENGLLDFTITRDKIPINSLDAAYMLNDETGYIKLNKFAATTEKEFDEAIGRLRKSNMKNLVLDLRGNGGGYMLAATALADKFFSDEKLIVYLSGRKTPRQDYSSKGSGSLSSTKIAVLTDESSASASEILAGALQDWDRGIIIGRRTFGKGLVQNGFYLTDGSMIRLTVARYYTPTGRLIQSPYNEGYDKYLANFYKRYTDGEMITSDSIHFPDSLRYKTLINKRTVYGGGGIMPDLFVAADTSGYSVYYRNLVRRGIINSFALEYYDKNRNRLNAEYKDFEYFDKMFEFSPEEIKALIEKGEREGVKYNELQFEISRDEILTILKALIASNIWQTNEYFRILNKDDVVIKRAVTAVSDNSEYLRILGY
ncbi:MAG: S41 family peptidase [Bacteroidales bacterium]|jgi:carboxyl-terminal processing protease|nr:S41 family peptidase [Bacteroidales bacterium]